MMTQTEVDLFRLLFETSPHPYLAIRPEPPYTIIAVNDRYLAATGTSRPEIVGRELFEVFPDNPREQKATGVADLRRSLERVVRERVQDVMGLQKYDIPRRDSAEFEVRYWSPANTPVFDTKGEVAVIIHHVEDVTAFVLSEASTQEEAFRRADRLEAEGDRMRAEILRGAAEVKAANRRFLAEQEQLRHTNEQLNELARLRREAVESERTLRQAVEMQLLHLARLNILGETVASLAHDLSQPLAAAAASIEGCQKLARMDDGPSVLEGLQLAQDQIVRAGEIVTRLRNFIRNRKTERSWVDVNSIVREAVALALPRAQRQGMSVAWNLGNLPPVRADRVQVSQVVVNLVRNAVEAMGETPDNELMIATTRKGDSLTVSVADNGPGVAPEMADRLFEPFVTTKSAGLGFGLSLCRRIVESHGGRIWVEPSERGGAAFLFTLPL